MASHAVLVTTDRPSVDESGSLPFLVRHVRPQPGVELLVRFETSMMITLVEPLVIDIPVRFEVAEDANVMLCISGSDFPHLVARDALTCVNLRFSGGGAWNNTGGGVHIVGADTRASFIGCQFYRCYSASESGAIAAHRIRALEISDCVFSDNCSTQEGGAIAASCDVEIVDSIFTHNVALMRGGALYAAEGSDVELRNCRFQENKSPLGANVYAQGRVVLREGTEI